MKAIVVLFALFAGLAGCSPSSPDIVPLSGTYIGYFHRLGKDTARVTLHFLDNTFEGSSNKEAYPFIGSGRFKQFSTTLSFTDASTRDHGIDSTLTLQGEFNYLYNDDGTVRIWRKNSEVEDEFILKGYLGEVVMTNQILTPSSGTETLQ
jgi:hypothetical protein